MKNIKSLVLVVANLFILLTTRAQISVSANVDHINPGGSDSLGNIHIMASGGTAPYTYKWTPGNIETQNLSDKLRNSYSLEVKDVNQNSSVYDYNLGYKTLWSVFNGTKMQGDSLIVSGTYSGQNPTALGKNILAASTSGWAELVLKQFTAPYLVGFTDGSIAECTGDHYDIDFGFHLTYGNILYAWSGGNFIYLGQANTGDVVRISRDATMFYLYLNNQLVLSRQILIDKSFKLKALLTGATLVNFGCSFDTPLKFTFDKEHTAFDNLFDGSAIVKTQGGIEPYLVTWPDGVVSDTRSGLFPGKYLVTVQDCTKTDEASKIIEIGVKPSWKTSQNIIYKSDSLRLKESQPVGVLVSNNKSFTGEEAWFELKPTATNADFCFGFIGNDRVNMDSSFVPPVFPEALMTQRISWIKDIYASAVANTLTYQNGLLNLGDAYKNLFFVRVHNNTITNLVHGATTAEYTFNAGDILKIGRGSDGTLYFKINEVIVFTSGTNISNQFLASSVLLKSATAAVSKMGVYTNATLESYAYRLKRSSVCGNDVCKNSVVTRTFDESGNVVSEGKQYFDSFNRPTQSQTKLMSENNILASEVMYDSYGRAAGQTLPAPLFTSEFCFSTTFFSNSSGQHYSISDFDKPNTTNNVVGERYNPANVGNTVQGSLGWYYSNNNTTNALVAADAFPYSRVEYYNDPLGRIYKTGDVGRFHKLGSGHETQTYYMNSGNELNRAYRRIFSSSQLRSYEMNDNFQALTYNGYYNTNIANAYKTVVINADGHDEITYTSNSGKVLATCTSGYDPDDCATETTSNKIFTNKRILVHLPKESNTSLKITDLSGGTSNLNYCSPKLYLYTTKYQLVLGTDYYYNSTTGAITFLGNYTNSDLFLEMAFAQLVLAGPSPGTLEFLESHDVGYTNWTVYYYDVKGRLKAYISPNEFQCQPASRVQVNNNNNPLAFSCDNAALLANVSLDGATVNSTDRLDAKLEFEPKFNTFNVLKTVLNAKDFHLQSNDTLAPKDSLVNFTSINMLDPDSIPVLVDTVSLAFYNDSIYQIARQELLDSAFKMLNGKSVRYEGDYVIGKQSMSGATQFFTQRPLHFNYTLNMNERSGDFVNNMPGEKLTFLLDSADLREASSIVVKCTNLKIQVQNFADAPKSSFSPCDLSMYVGDLDAQILTTVNSNINLNLTAHFISTPQSPAPPAGNLPDYSKKFYYNEYDHLIATETPDEGRTDYLYDLQEDKLLFTQNDKQRANGGKFNYIKYDVFGRQVESGEFDPTVADPFTSNYQFQTYVNYKNNVAVNSGYTSVGLLADYASSLPTTPRCTDASVIGYDVPFSGSSFSQNYLNGKISYVFNDHHTLLYTYDELGKVVKTSESFNILPGNKTMEYNYDFFGNLASTVYQKGATDEFTQKYSLDADQRLVGTTFSRPPTYPVQTFQPGAQMSYYLHGPLKRKILGDNLQGLDYVYTIRGLLKSVNCPQNAANGSPGDPSQDGLGLSPIRFKDFFKYSLDYYQYDYERNNTPVTASYDNGSFGQLNTSYTGQIKAIRWNGDAMAPPPGFSAGPYMYEYNYDELYRLKEANYGTYAVSSNVVNFTASNAFKLSNIAYDRNGNIKTLKRYANAGAGNTPVLMDDLNYNYNATKRNRLTKVADNITASLGLSAESDFPNQTNSNNYSYDEIGQLLGNLADNQVYTYNCRGLVTKVTTAANVLIAEFGYNSSNQRQWKTSYNSVGSPVSTMFYVYDVSGKQIATYEKTNFSTPGVVPTLKDFHLYGGGRIGLFDAASAKPFFELTDHLGNVRVVFTDGSTVAQSIAQLCDYYPHGSPLPGSGFYSSVAYRFGYQGQEKDPATGLTNFELRQMDPRLGRWLNPDPFGQHHSPYLAMSNNPVNSIDPNGGQDYPINYYDANGNSTNSSWYSNGGTDMTFMKGSSTSNAAILREFRASIQTDATAVVNERLNWHLEKESRGINMSNYLRYKALHQNGVGEWGSYAWQPSYVPYRVGNSSDGLMSGGAYLVDIRVFVTNETYKIPDFNDINFLGSERVRRGGAHGEPRKYGGDGSGSVMDNVYKAVDAINQFNPIANLMDVVSNAFTGKDRFGNDMSQGDAWLKAASIMPFGKLGMVAKGGGSWLQGGKTFAQYKAARGGTETLAKISTSTGTQRISTEFHHAFISQSMQRAYNLPNWLVNNRVNVWKLNTVQHSLIDSYRYNFLRAGFKSDVGWFGKYNWFTKF